MWNEKRNDLPDVGLDYQSLFGEMSRGSPRSEITGFEHSQIFIFFFVNLDYLSPSPTFISEICDR